MLENLHCKTSRITTKLTVIKTACYCYKEEQNEMERCIEKQTKTVT